VIQNFCWKVNVEVEIGHLEYLELDGRIITEMTIEEE
jgi:hypothetical protein